MYCNSPHQEIFQSKVRCFSCGQQQEIMHPALLRAVNRIARKESAEKWLQVRCNATLSLAPTVTSVSGESITDFRSAPEFDLVLFTFGRDKLSGESLYEKFSYCRMLLRPGGSMLLIFPETRALSIFAKIADIIRFNKTSDELVALKRTGYIFVGEKSVGNHGRVVYGKRPGGNVIPKSCS